MHNVEIKTANCLHAGSKTVELELDESEAASDVTVIKTWNHLTISLINELVAILVSKEDLSQNRAYWGHRNMSKSMVFTQKFAC